MRMNLKVRMKNAYFWLTFIPAIITFIYSVLACFDIVPAISEAMVINIATSVVTALTTMGVLIDPTTEGIFDSARALMYEKPGQLPSDLEELDTEGTDDGM